MNIKAAVTTVAVVLATTTLFTWSSHAVAGPQDDVACDVAGVLSTDRRWDPADCGSYRVTADVKVAEGVTLTVAPGTIVRFLPGTGLDVEGILVARGTAAEPIRFESGRPSPQPGDWKGLAINGPETRDDEAAAYAGSTVLAWCIIHYAGGGTEGAVVVSGAPPHVVQSTIEDNLGNGVFRRATLVGAGSAPLRIEGSWIRRNGANGVALNGGDIVLRDSELVLNGGRGLYVHSGTSLRLDVTGNVVRFNHSGGMYLDFAYTGVVQNNVITDNRLYSPNDAGLSVANRFLETLVVTHNDLHDNRQADGTAVDLRNESLAVVTAVENWWGTTDRARIDAHIMDFSDDRTLGAVNFEPFLSASNGRASPVPRLFLPLLELLR